MIHVCYGLNDWDGRFTKFVGTSMLSLFENMSTPPPFDKVTIHVLHDNTLTDDNRDKLTYIAGKYNQTVKFYNVEILCKNRIEEFKKLFAQGARSRWTLASDYPFLI